VWTASTDGGRIVGYDLYRDGTLIVERWDTLRYTDGNLEPATTYQYTVIAVDDEGNYSNPNAVQVTTLDVQLLTSHVNWDNYIELLRHVFDIYTGNAYIADLATLPDWPDSTYSGTPTSDSTEAEITCLNGGTAQFTPVINTSIHSSYAWEFKFHDCQDNTVVLDGQLLREKNYGSRLNGGKVTSTGLTIDGQPRQVFYSGGMDEWESFASHRETTELNYSVSDGLSSFELTDANTRVTYYGPFWMNGSFTIKSELTDNRHLHAEVLEEFQMKLNAAYQGADTGLLKLMGDDGSELKLNVANNDDLTVTIEITTSDGTNETFTRPWSLWEVNLRVERRFLW
ncbi:MAG: fibronectin type III domain-containing protein, partial [Granulosicoccus sp.]|nr:fibronectin type III domain-containing protein [Granulosicoccus sp.]